MKKLVVLGVLLAGIGNAFAVCDTEREERDKFRNLCYGFTGASVGVATYAGIAIPVVGGLFGIVPGLIANNQCRIYQEKEANLARCEQDYTQRQRDELARQRGALEDAQRRNNRINEINPDYNRRDEEARNNHRAAVRQTMQRYVQQGRNLRDPLVQAELREEVQRMEGELSATLQDLAEERQRDINAVN